MAKRKKKQVLDEEIKSVVNKAVSSVLIDVVSDKVMKLEYSIQLLHYFLRRELGLKKYHIDIDFEAFKIDIHSTPIKCIVDPSVWTALAIKIDLPDFTFTFEQDYHE
jgi:hypothetical protein